MMNSCRNTASRTLRRQASGKRASSTAAAATLPVPTTAPQSPTTTSSNQVSPATLVAAAQEPAKGHHAFMWEGYGFGMKEVRQLYRGVVWTLCLFVLLLVHLTINQ